MSTIDHDKTTGESPTKRDTGQFALAALLVVIGIYTVYDATSLRVGFADPVGPRAFPYLIGSVLAVLGILLAVAAYRGDVPESEGGEDVDLTLAPDWTTVLKLLGVLVFTIATVDLLGWVITGSVLFAGSAWSLGSKTLVRDVLIGIVLSLASFYAFYSGLGIPLDAGLLDGIL